MPVPVAQLVFDERIVTAKKHKLYFITDAQTIAVSPFQRRTRQRGILSGGKQLLDLFAQTVQPWRSSSSVSPESRSGLRIFDVRCRMKIVGLKKTPPKLFCQYLAYCCFAGAGDSENNDDHGAFFPPPPDLLYRERDNHEQRIKNPNAHGRSLVTQWRSRHVRVADLHDDQSDPERNYSSLTDCPHRISRQIKNNAAGEQRDLQRKLRVAIIPQTKADLRCVVVIGRSRGCATRSRIQCEKTARPMIKGADLL